MHFGMTAFDLFHAMYLEEIENQGRPGWPGSPSVPGAEDIPQAIVENNIYGIDIDLRAIQLSALSLYLKAKTRNKDARLTRYRLTCTDIPTLGQDMIQTFVDSLETGHRVSKKLLLEILPLLNKAYYLGSLLKVEEVVEQVVEKERVFFEDGHQPALFAEFKTGEQKSLDLYYEKGIDWSRVRQELAAALSRFSEAHPHTAGGFLAGESVKGLGLIDALIRKHDVVVGNPPYSGRRNWNDTLSTELKKLYDKKSGDFYTCFIDRCIDLTEEGGFTGMITVHSFMFTSSHEPVREKIIRETAIETMAHLGTRSFEDLSNPNAQGFVMYALRKSTGKFNDESRGVYFRLVKELSISEKEAAFQRGLADLNSANVGKKSNVYILPQEKLKVIPTWPFVYWLSEGVRNLFEGTLMGAIADIKCGMTTSDNFRFLRLWWELGNEKVDHSQKNIENFKSNLKWFPYMKGGEVRRWYGNQDYIVNWKDNGKEIKNVSSFPRAMQFYFKEGSTYSFLTISNLSVRYLPSGFLFDMAGSSIFPKSIENYLIIGILNSKVYMYLIKTISPTVSYQVGDLARIPIPWLDKNPSLSNDIIKMVKECIDLKRKETQFSETSWEFLSPIDWREGIYFLLDIEQNLALLETGISKAVYNLYEIEPCDIEQIEIEFGKLPGDMPQKESLTTTEIETKSHTVNYSNMSQPTNYKEMYGREGMLNYIQFPYTSNIKPYVNDYVSSSGYSNMSIVNETDYDSTLGNFTTKAINIYQNAGGSTLNPRLYYLPFAHTVDWNVNFSFVIFPHTLYFDINLYVYCGANYVVFGIYRSGSTALTRCSIWNGTVWATSTNVLLNNNYPLLVRGSVNTANLAELSICSISNLSSFTYISKVIPSTIKYVSYYQFIFVRGSYTINCSVIAFDSTHFLHHQNPSGGGYSISQFDPDYTPTRILSIYHVSQKSYSTFDYPNYNLPFFNTTYQNSANSSISYQSISADYKQPDSYMIKNRLVNAVNISFVQPYSNMSILTDLTIQNWNDFFYCVAIDHPKANFDISIHFGSFSFGVLSNSTNKWIVYREWNASRVYMNALSFTDYMEPNEEIIIGCGIASPTITSSSFFVRSGRRICYFNQSVVFCNFSQYIPYVSVKNYNVYGSAGVDTIVIKGIFTNDVDFSFSTGSSTALYFAVESYKLRGYYETNFTHDFTYPTTALYDYWHKVLFLNSSFDITFYEYYYCYFKFVTNNATYYLLVENDVEKHYGKDLWGYGQYDNFSITVYDYILFWGWNNEKLDYTITFLIRWYFYERADDPSLFSMVFDMLVPSAFIIVFPLAFKGRFGAKGAVVGLILGFIVMGISTIIPFTISIVLCVASAILAILVFKMRENDKYTVVG